MKKLFMAAAALTIGLAMIPLSADPSLAASKKKRSMAVQERSAFCDLSRNARNLSSWNEHYGCLKTPGRQAAVRAQPVRETTGAGGMDAATRSTYCGLARNARNLSSWNEYYGCLK